MLEADQTPIYSASHPAPKLIDTHSNVISNRIVIINIII